MLLKSLYPSVHARDTPKSFFAIAILFVSRSYHNYQNGALSNQLMAVGRGVGKSVLGAAQVLPPPPPPLYAREGR
jgi:hypothetical protein